MCLPVTVKRERFSGHGIGGTASGVSPNHDDGDGHSVRDTGRDNLGYLLNWD